MELKLTYKGISRALEIPNAVTEAKFSIDFEGQYLVEFEYKLDGVDVRPTGNAMDGGGNPHDVALSDFEFSATDW